MINTRTNLQQDVEMELRWDSRIESDKIGVTVKDEVVQLDGQVNSFFEKWAAEEAALRVSSVQAVANEIQVNVKPSDKRSDADIAQAAIDHLGWSFTVPSSVKSSVSNGCITVQGTVTAHYQKVEAERILRSLKGVNGFVNDIVVRPKLDSVVVKDNIIKAFHRSADIDAKNIHVEVSGSQVTLKGHVRSWLEREQARLAVWGDPGVSNCVDLMTYSSN